LIFAHGAFAKDELLKGLRHYNSTESVNLGNYHREDWNHPGGTGILYYIVGKSRIKINPSGFYDDLYSRANHTIFVHDKQGVDQEPFDLATLSQEQKIKIFYADFFLKGETASTSIGYQTFKSQDWKTVGLDGVLVQLSLNKGQNGVDKFKKFLSSSKLTPDALVRELGSGTVEAEAKSLWTLINDTQSANGNWPEHSLGWLSAHPDYVVGKDSSMQQYVPKYADVYNKLMDEAKWGTHIVIGEWAGLIVGETAVSVYSVIKGIRNAANIVGSSVRPVWEALNRPGVINRLRLRLPVRPNGKGPTSGILGYIDQAGELVEIPLVSGRAIRGSFNPANPLGANLLNKGHAGMDLMTFEHVEAAAAQIIRTRQIDNAVLVLNNAPCAYLNGGRIRGCEYHFSDWFPRGSRVQVYGPDAYSQAFLGRGVP